MRNEEKKLQKQTLPDLESAFRKVYKEAATEINNTFSGPAARALRGGNAEVMTVYKSNKKAIEKL